MAKARCIREDCKRAIQFQVQQDGTRAKNSVADNGAPSMSEFSLQNRE
jgi:hypothetical protein